MPEDIKVQAAGEGAGEGTGAGEGQKTGADYKKDTGATDTGDEDAGEGEGTAGAEGDKDTSKGTDKPKAPPKDASADDTADDGAEPPVRQRLSTKDFIIGRKHAQLAKKQEKAGGEEDDEEEGGEVAPEDANLIKKVVSPMLAPIIEKSLDSEDDKEIRAFLEENPDFKPFEAKARRFMKHPSRRQLPVESVFYEVAGKKLIKIGADRERAATQKAKDSQTGGGSNRAGEGGTSDWDLPKDQFEAKQERIRRGK